MTSPYKTFEMFDVMYKTEHQIQTSDDGEVSHTAKLSYLMKRLIFFHSVIF
jgi:hypothetical protein